MRYLKRVLVHGSWLGSALLLNACAGGGGPTKAATGGAGNDGGTPGTAGNTSTGGTSGGSGGAPAAGGSGGCATPKFPFYSALPSIPKLPDPFLFVNGGRAATRDDWSCRRSQLSAQIQHYELGEKPTVSGTVSGTVSDTAVNVTVEEGGTSISFTATVVLPSTGTAPYPAFITIGGSSLNNTELSNLGVALINFDNNDMAAQQDASSRGQGKFYTLYGLNNRAGAMIAWAWGVSRVIDVLESSGQTTFDPKHLGVTGCSRNGKGALVAGAFDDRVVLTIPQESGTDGSGLWRVADAQQQAGQTVQTLAEITGENCWFTTSFNQFNTGAVRLPYDHHELLGLVAPRGLLVIENTTMEWLGNIRTYTGGIVAHRIYEALGVPDNMGVSQIGNHNHCAFPASQQPEVTAYVRKFLLDDASANTAVLKTDGGYTVDDAKWVDWTTPSLK